MHKREILHIILLLAAVVALLVMVVEALQPTVAAQEAAVPGVALDDEAQQPPRGVAQWLWRLFISASCDEAELEAWEANKSPVSMPPCWLVMEAS